MEWYYAQGDAQRGPLSEDIIRELVANSVITPRTLVWKIGMEKWLPSCEVSDLPKPQASPPEAPSEIPPEIPLDQATAPGSINWFYKRSGMEHGPVSETELKELIIDGSLKPTTQVRQGGVNPWQPLSEVSELEMPINTKDEQPEMPITGKGPPAARITAESEPSDQIYRLICRSSSYSMHVKEYRNLNEMPEEMRLFFLHEENTKSPPEKDVTDAPIFEHNDIEYWTIEEMPPDVLKIYREIEHYENEFPTDPINPLGPVFFTSQHQDLYSYNGTVYKSEDEMPPSVLTFFERWHREGPEGSCFELIASEYTCNGNTYHSYEKVPLPYRKWFDDKNKNGIPDFVENPAPNIEPIDDW